MATERISFEAQREFPRWPVSTSKPIRVSLGPAGSGQLIDISMGGARIKSVAPLRRDSELPVSIELPDRAPLGCSARVVWSKPTGAAGLRFLKLDDEQKALLSAWIAELQQAAGERGHRNDEFTRMTAQVKNMKLNNADALSLIAHRAVQITGASSVAIALGKPEHMICLARAGDAPELGSPIPAQGFTGECVRSRKLVHCVDAASDPRAGDLKQGSVLVVPLLVNLEMRGVMLISAQQPAAFDGKRIETIESLADAVIFVTHNTMPRARAGEIGPLATVTTMPKRAPFSASPVSKPSDSGRITAFPAPAATSPNPEPVAIADTSVPVAPLAAPVQAAIAPIAPKPVVVERKVDRPIAAAPAVYHPVPPPASSNKLLIVAIPVAALIIAVPLTIHFLRQKPAPTPAVATAPAVDPVATNTNNSVSTGPEVATVSTATAEVPAATMTTKPSAIKEEKPLEQVSTTEKVEKKAALIQKAPEPAPMVLASGAPVRTPTVEVPDGPAPVATVAAMKMPGINIPAAATAPKLMVTPPKKITGGALLEHPSPVYPQMAIAERLEGQVKLQVTISPTGTVENVRKISGPPLLVGAAINAVKRWRYEPKRIDGQAVPSEETIALDFKLPSGR